MRYIVLTLSLLGGALLPAHADSALMQQQQMIQQQQQQFQQQRNSAAQQSLRNTQTQIQRDAQAQQIQQLNQRMQRNDPLWQSQQGVTPTPIPPRAQ
ncbi:hypothetical protein ACOGYG_003316 [Edwardsiella piscicida]|uniref:hypothetical protein n=1 Tax=Edwardsiella piscicida TaxID=1263550 RepID=UPI0002C0A0FA|nr:hypothetical protein [Edwardsiella piscicida]AGH75285.1 hypothetical protein ETAC_15820 [Edwardsiella piscicida C07-087]EKS7781514.1 hypothetical protein [Edwardsiella piscicida]EKS7784846.1 hypothetical protein [Edwardsiella piscicida]UCQ24288.1 hypothetical protein DCE91_16400 [Edwardsiella piscicida]UCQ34429.1 hypothetical protein DCF34_16025 [Edwardsiella piscicida]